MKILLVRPISEKASNVMPLLGLGYLAYALRKHNVIYLDCVKEKMDLNRWYDYLKNNKFDYIGFQVFSCDVSSVLKMIESIKETKIIVGGPHISGKPDFVLHERIDYGFIGEAEIGFPKLLEEEYEEDVPNLVWKNKGKLIINKQEFHDHIDDFAVDWEKIKPDTYPIAPHGSFVKTPPSAPIIVTRGCIFSCNYCAGKKSTGTKLRKRSIHMIMDELTLLYNKFGIREFHFEDDNFTLDKQFAKEVCREIIKWKGNKKVSFACPNGVRLETLDEELLNLMEKAGFYSFAIGIESGNNRVLKKMGRNVTKEIMKEKIELIAKTNIKMTGFCMMGYPTETLEEMEETARFTRELPIHRVQYGNFHPLPGTPIYDELIQSGEIKDIDWDAYQDNTISYSPKGVTKEQLKKKMEQSFRKFYLRPKIILGLIREIKNWYQFKVLVKRAIESFI